MGAVYFIVGVILLLLSPLIREMEWASKRAKNQEEYKKWECDQFIEYAGNYERYERDKHNYTVAMNISKPYLTEVKKILVNMIPENSMVRLSFNGGNHKNNFYRSWRIYNFGRFRNTGHRYANILDSDKTYFFTNDVQSSYKTQAELGVLEFLLSEDRKDFLSHYTPCIKKDIRGMGTTLHLLYEYPDICKKYDGEYLDLSKYVYVEINGNWYSLSDIITSFLNRLLDIKKKCIGAGGMIPLPNKKRYTVCVIDTAISSDYKKYFSEVIRPYIKEQKLLRYNL